MQPPAFTLNRKEVRPMSRYMNLENTMCKELERLEEKYRNGSEMSEGDLRRIDLLAHSLKCLIRYISAKESEEAQRVAYEGNNQYYSTNARYMNQGGQYPNYIPSDRRW